MTNDLYSSPIAQDETPAPGQNFLVRHLLNLIGLAGSYLLGILLSAMMTDAEFVLAGKNLLPWYVCMSPIGFALWFLCAIQNFPSPPFAMWSVFVVLLIPIVCELLSFFNVKIIRLARVLWIGFPVGFVGTLGVYWAGSLSI